MTIVLGSTSPTKRRALERAIAQLRLHLSVHEVDAPSEVSAQPMHHTETYRGALHRARNALAMDSAADLALGIEHGIIVRPTRDRAFALDGAIVVLLNRRQVIGVGTSACTPVPLWLYARLVCGAEHSKVIRGITGTSEEDATMFWTKGALPREEQLTHAVIAAFVPFVQEAAYAQAPPGIAVTRS